MALLVVVVVLSAVTLVLTLWYRADPQRDAAWLAGTDVVAPDEAEIYSRYLARLRTHRRVGGAFGVLFAIVVGTTWAGSVTIGVGTHGPLADPLFCGVAGVLVGALSAETYRLRLPKTASIPAQASASLAPRPALPGGRQVVVARWLAGAAIAGGAVLAAFGQGAGPLVTAGFGGALVALCELTREAVRHRRRAALSDRGLVVDANLRAFAGRTVAWLEVAVAAMSVAWVPSGLPDGDLDALGTVVAVAGLVAAVVCLVKASPRPPRWVVPAAAMRPVAGA